MIESNSKKVYRMIDESLKDKHQEAYIMNNGRNGDSGSSKDKSIANLMEEKELLNKSSQIAGDSISAGIGMLQSFERQTQLMSVNLI